jgi:hypothetical protein
MIALRGALVVLLVTGFAVGQEPKKGDAPDKVALGTLLKTYLSTEFEAREKYVVDAADFKAGQEAYFKGASLAEDVQVTVTKVKKCEKANWYEVTATVKGKVLDRATASVSSFVVAEAKDGFKVDWGASSGYNPVPYKTWVAGKDGEVTLRVEAELSDYYGYEWRAAKETHYAIRCREESLSATPFTAYIARDSADGKKLHELLKDGEKHRVTVAIQRTGTESAVAGMKSLTSASWVK